MSKKKKPGNLGIYEKYIDLVIYTNDIIRKFPKSEKFALVDEIKKATYVGLRNLMYAIKTYDKDDKIRFLREIDINMAILRVHVRLAARYKYISETNYEAWSSKITTVCNMLGAWITACQKR